MFNLLIKDLLIQKKSIKVLLFYIIFVFVVMNGVFNNDGGFLLIIPTLVYLLWTTAFQYDEKNKCDNIINSLPVTRKEVVLAKYISVIFYLVISIVFFELMVLIIRLIGFSISIEVINFDSILKSIVGISILCSLNFPLIFKFGLRKGKLYNVIVYVLFFVGISSLAGIIGERPEIFRYISNNILLVRTTSILGSVLVLSISLMLSLKFYTDKEF